MTHKTEEELLEENKSLRSALEVIHDLCLLRPDPILRQLHNICDQALGHDK